VAADNQNDISTNVRFAGELREWMAQAGVPDGATQADLAVGFADIIFAAGQAEAALRLLLQTDPRSPEGADRALTHLGYLNALFLSEIKGHLEDLEQAWPGLEMLLASRLPPDPDE
jgi:hypothetical protein